MRTSVGDHRGGTERAFSGVNVRIEFGLRAAVGAGVYARLFDVCLSKPVLDRALEVQLNYAARPRARALDRLHISAVITGQLMIAGIKPQIRPASVAGKAVVFFRGLSVSHLQYLMHKAGRHDAQRPVKQDIVTPEMKKPVESACR